MRRIAFVLFTIALLGILAACGGGTSTTPGAATGNGSNTSDAAAPIKEGGILRVGYTDPPDGINPFVCTNQVSYLIFQETYPSPVHYDENLQPLAFVIYGAPQVMGLAVDLDEGLVQVSAP